MSLVTLNPFNTLSKMKNDEMEKLESPEHKNRKTKKEKSRKRKWLKATLITLGVLVLLYVGAYIIMNIIGNNRIEAEKQKIVELGESLNIEDLMKMED